MTELSLVTVETNSDAFIAAVDGAVKRGAETLAILPENDLANAIASRFPGLKWAPAAQADVLCLTHHERGPLERALHAELDRNKGTVIVPRVADHGLNRPLFLISIPKAGTHLLYRFAEELGFKAGVICPEIPTPGYWYCLEYSNSHTVPRDFFVDSVRRAPFGNRLHPFPYTPALFIVRHPWDILLSEANYYRKPGNAVFSGFYDGLDFDARIKRLLEDGSMLGRFSDRMLAFEPWLHFDNVITLAFEDLVGELGGGEAARQLRLIWSIQVKLGVPGDPRDIGRRLFDRRSPTFNEGRIGSHSTALPTELIEHLNSNNGQVLDAFGYQGGNKTYTVFAETWRTQPLRYQENKLDATPIVEETNYWGHNLVRYRSRFYAIPISIGPFDLARDEKRLAGFLSADNLPAVRTAVTDRALTSELRTRLKSLENKMQESDNRVRAVEQRLGLSGKIKHLLRRI
jgi:hypothetical protein